MSGCFPQTCASINRIMRWRWSVVNPDGVEESALVRVPASACTPYPPYPPIQGPGEKAKGSQEVARQDEWLGDCGREQRRIAQVKANRLTRTKKSPTQPGLASRLHLPVFHVTEQPSSSNVRAHSSSTWRLHHLMIQELPINIEKKKNSPKIRVEVMQVNKRRMTRGQERGGAAGAFVLIITLSRCRPSFLSACRILPASWKTVVIDSCEKGYRWDRSEGQRCCQSCVILLSPALPSPLC